MKTLRVGIASYARMKARTIAIARGEYRPAAGEPKAWFTSTESFARVLSDRNRALLGIIAESAPKSLTSLAEMTGRKKSNLSRTLKTMERYGFVHLSRGAGAQSSREFHTSGSRRHCRCQTQAGKGPQ